MQQQEWAVFLGLATAVLGTIQTFWILKVSRDDRRWRRRAAFSVALMTSFVVLMGWMALDERLNLVVFVPLYCLALVKKLLEKRGAL